jgi:hypothetical protein
MCCRKPRKDDFMRIVRAALVLAALSATAFVVAKPAEAAPAFAGASAAQAATASDVTEVRSRRRYHRRHSYRYRYGYGPRYGYYYGGRASRGGYPPQECVFDEGQGRYRPCSMGPR